MIDYKTLNETDSKGLYKEELCFEKKPSAGDLARSMQRVTEHAMEALGMDIQMLNDQHLLWVLCFSQIEILRMPEAGEKVVMFSWPGEERLGMCPRRYVLYSEQGEALFSCTSLSSPVDERTRTMVLPEQMGISFPVITIPGEPKNPRLKEKGPEPEQEVLHAVKDSEIDQNNHVNNAFYLDWIEPLFTEASKGEPNTRSIWINYVKEILAGQTVTIRYAKEADGIFVKGYVNEANCFIAKMVW